MQSRPMRALVVDDEPIARQILIDELEGLLEVELAGDSANGNPALLKIAKLQPDLMFLDSQMPVMGGFEVIQNLQDDVPVVVIVTAFDQHAIRAFEAGAVGYLLKPVTPARLKTSVARAQRLRERPHDAAENMALQSDRDVVWIILARQRLLSTCSLQELERRLEGSQFRRGHRNAIVNINSVDFMVSNLK